VVVSECSEGLGSAEYAQAQRRLLDLGLDGFQRAIDGQRFAAIDEWQTQMQLKPMRRATVQLHSGRLAEGDRSLTGVQSVASVEAAVMESVRAWGDPRVGVIPEGPYLVPVYRPPLTS
jgi:hypothetical protein